ncbi:hypothetical protein TNCV_1807381 [Trichonephila clavipes]|nr:hypothetical protein TNCV_1807381 [Trichonephila clavipes]
MVDRLEAGIEKLLGGAAVEDESAAIVDYTLADQNEDLASGLYRSSRKESLRGTIPIFSNFVATVVMKECDWASVEDLGSVCIEHMILSCLGESSCP